MPKLTEKQIIYIEQAKLKKKISDKKYSLERKYSKMLDSRKDKLEERKRKELDKFISKVEKAHKKELNAKIRKLKGQKKPGKKKQDTENQGLTKSQIERSFRDTLKLTNPPLTKYCALESLDKNNRGQCICCKEWRDWKRLFGGHLFSKEQWKSVAFEPTNIFPICGMCNKRQSNRYGKERETNAIEVIGIDEWNRLKELSLEPPKYTKADMYEYREKRQKKLDKEMKRRGILGEKKI